MKRHLLFAILLLVSCHLMHAQDSSSVFYRQYATQPYMKGLLASDTAMQGNRSAIERQAFDFQRHGLPDTPI